MPDYKWPYPASWLPYNQVSFLSPSRCPVRLFADPVRPSQTPRVNTIPSFRGTEPRFPWVSRLPAALLFPLSYFLSTQYSFPELARFSYNQLFSIIAKAFLSLGSPHHPTWRGYLIFAAEVRSSPSLNLRKHRPLVKGRATPH